MSQFTFVNNDFIPNTSSKITNRVTTWCGNQFNIQGLDNVRLSIRNNGRIINIIIHDVQFAPELTSKLVSESILTSKGYVVYKNNSNCEINKDNFTIQLTKCPNNLYIFGQALVILPSPN